MDPVVYFFLLGVIARLARSDLRIPGTVYEALSIYLLLAIGLKGGVHLAQHTTPGLGPQLLAVVAMGAVIPLLVYPVLRWIGRLPVQDAAAIAAHYGSVSLVTFAVGSTWLGSRGMPYDSQLTLFLAALEAPGIVVGILLGRMADTGRSGGLATALHEVLLGKSVFLLLGGILIGWLIGPQHFAQIGTLFAGLFKGLLCLFLVELGLIAAERLRELRRFGVFLVLFGTVAPVALGTLGCAVGILIGLSAGGAALLGLLAASASYIAAPAAVRSALPRANPALALSAALGVTFPFNITLGIPLYAATARWMEAMLR